MPVVGQCTENGLDREIEEIGPGTILFIPGGKDPSFDYWGTPIVPIETSLLALQLYSA